MRVTRRTIRVRRIIVRPIRYVDKEGNVISRPRVVKSLAGKGCDNKEFSIEEGLEIIIKEDKEKEEFDFERYSKVSRRIISFLLSRG